MDITKKNFVRYAVLPGIWPRIRAFFGSGFSLLASLIAVIYYNVGLLPAGHAYLNSKNYGRYGIRHVVAEAGSNLVFSKKHADQVILYFTILIGLALLALQIVLLLLSLVTNPVMASTFYNMFIVTPAGHTSSQDLAFIVLDNVFGIKSDSGGGSAVGFYNSCISDLGTNCLNMQGQVIPSPTVYPLPMHVALHRLLHFYTLGISIVALLIIFYFIITIVGETVTTGTPFGRRFNRAWFVPRLIVFFALIAPISLTGNNQGINVAQIIVFSAAKFGSNMATNAWLQFNDSSALLAADFLGNQQSMLALPNVPEVGGITQFMHVVRLCMYTEKIVNGINVLPYVVREHNDDTTNVTLHDGVTTSQINNMGGTTNDYLNFFTTDFEDAVVFSRYKTVVVRFGHRNPPGGFVADPDDPPGAYDDEWGHVKPTCGEIHFEPSSTDIYSIGSPIGGGHVTDGIQGNYYYSIDDYLKTKASNVMTTTTISCHARFTLPIDGNPECAATPYTVVPGGTPLFYFGFTSPSQLINSRAARSSLERFNAANKYYITGETLDWGSYAPAAGPGTTGILADMRTDFSNAAYLNNLLMPPAVRQRGWAGAALWYNKIAEVNGLANSAVFNLPMPFKYPEVMEIIAEQHKETDSNYSFPDRFNPRLQNGNLAKLPRPGDQYIAAVLYSDYNYWRTSPVNHSITTTPRQNSVIDFLNLVFGTQGLFDILENDGVHPLAMLSSMGKGMVDASIRNLFLGMGVGVASTLSDGFFAKMGETAAGFITQFSMVTLSIGFMLFYVLPFMPFIYFFFAFSGWIKSIFEAVVAMPLWAVAHIKIDGEGLPGPWATNGYFLIFEIFLRPTLIIVGFIAAISLFGALVDTLHDVFHTLVLTASGFDMEKEMFVATALPGGVTTTQFIRGPLDELFFTVIYTIIVYMIGLSCFKLIDEIPNNIIRWMGVTVSTFRETAGDPAGELTGKMYRASQMTNAQLNQLMNRMKGLSSGDEVANQYIRTRF